MIAIFETIIHDDERETWLKDIFYSGIEDYGLKMSGNCKRDLHGMGFENILGPVIPAAISIKFLINTAGNELLESVNIGSC